MSGVAKACSSDWLLPFPFPLPLRLLVDLMATGWTSFLTSGAYDFISMQFALMVSEIASATKQDAVNLHFKPYAQLMMQQICSKGASCTDHTAEQACMHNI